MSVHVLITGGAGFIGSHVTDELLAAGHRVRILDNLSEQVHGAGAGMPPYLDRRAELVRGDVRDASAVAAALRDIDAVIHLAAMVGVGQSMYQVDAYTDVNQRGTAVLMEALVKHPVHRLVVASSMSIYGEGLYRDNAGRAYEQVTRTAEQMRRQDWEARNAAGEALEPAPTPETKRPVLASNYALSKYAQEQMCLIVGQAYRIPTVALRFFNVYGPRQSLSNPYTGVLAIFASRLLNGKPPIIYEDGRQQRDFVSVHDIALACRLAIESPEAPGHVLNVGSGRRYSIVDIARRLALVMGREDVSARISGEYRVGDIRHCYADVSLAHRVLGYQPRVAFQDGMVELARWLRGQVAVDRVEQAHAELNARGLTV